MERNVGETGDVCLVWLQAVEDGTLDEIEEDVRSKKKSRKRKRRDINDDDYDDVPSTSRADKVVILAHVNI